MRNAGSMSESKYACLHGMRKDHVCGKLHEFYRKVGVVSLTWNFARICFPRIVGFSVLHWIESQGVNSPCLYMWQFGSILFGGEGSEACLYHLPVSSWKVCTVKSNVWLNNIPMQIRSGSLLGTFHIYDFKEHLWSLCHVFPCCMLQFHNVSPRHALWSVLSQKQITHHLSAILI